MFGKKGQGAIEYLLILGAVVIIAIIVITTVITIAQQPQNDTPIATAKNTVRLKCFESCDYTITTDECTAMGGSGTPCSVTCIELLPDCATP